jgi:hypothetical protein
MPEVVLRTCHCRACEAVFCVCRPCDRGQCYCGQACRLKARQRQLRAARRRHQQTEAGRHAHRMRQRVYRLRRSKACVTDHGSHPIMSPQCPSPTNLGNCALCGRYSRWIDPFPAIPPRWVHRGGDEWSAGVQKTSFQMIANTLRYGKAFLGRKDPKKDPDLVGRADYICDGNLFWSLGCRGQIPG